MIGLTSFFSFLFIAYITAIIVFMQHYINYTYIIDVLLVGLFVFYIIYKKIKIKINLLIILYSIFTMLTLASSFWAISFDETSFKSLQMLFIIINLIVLYNLMVDFNLKTSFMKGVLLGSLFNYLIMMGLISVPFETFMADRYMGTTGNPNSLAILMLMSMFISMYYLMDDTVQRNKFYYYQYINILFSLYAILLSVSKKGIVFGLILLLFYILILLKSKKGIGKLFILTILGSIIIYFFVDLNQINDYFDSVAYRFNAFSEALDGRGGANNSTAIRKNLIDFGLTVIQNEPLFGYGLANFRFLSGGQYAHNNFIEVLVGLGLVGFSIFYYMYVHILFMAYKMKKSDLKYLIVMFIFILLLMDVAVVSYASKINIYILIFIYVLISEKSKKQGIR